MNALEKSGTIVPAAAAPATDVDPWAEAFKQAYHNSKSEWFERYGTYIAQARSWQRVAVLALIVAVLEASGLLWLGLQSQIVPYIVQVDKVGAVGAIVRADRMERPNKDQIRAQLRRWIRAVRTVFVDAAAQRGYIDEAYAMINARSDAFGMLNEHMRQHNPFERAKSETVNVKVESVLPLPGETWQIEWREETFGRDGVLKTSQAYQATVTIAFTQPRDEQTLMANPLGLYVNAFYWTQRQ